MHDPTFSAAIFSTLGAVSGGAGDPTFYVALVLALGAVSQLLAWKLKVPSILFLLAFGFCAGEFLGLRVDDFIENTELLLTIVSFSVAIILFEGGLTLKFSELKESGSPVLRLCTVGVLIAWVGGAGAARLIFGMDIRLALLMGAILVVTGPTVVGPLLRAIRPSRRVGSMVKWEGIVVDPIGAILAVLVFQAALAGDMQQAAEVVLIAIGKCLLVGIVLAFVLAKLVEFALRHHLIPDFLHSPFLLAIVGVAFAGSNYVQAESGLLTVTVLGMALANQKTASVKHILEFKENLRVLLISTLFIVLSGRVEGENLLKILAPALLFLAVLVIVVRPLSVFGALAGTKIPLGERRFLAMLAPRGIVAAAVTSIFALEIQHAADHGHLGQKVAAQAAQMEALVFLVIVGTVTIYSLAASPLAKKLGLSAGSASGVLFAGADHWARVVAKGLQKDGIDVVLLDTNFSNISKARMDGLTAHRANILSDYAEDEFDFNGLGLLVAGTVNDEVNSMAAREYITKFGSANSWQLAPSDDNAHHTTAVSHHMRGRILFPGRPHHADLEALVEADHYVKSTQITEQFTLQDFFKRYGSESLLLFARSVDGALKPVTDEMKVVPNGTTLYALVAPETDDNPPLSDGPGPEEQAPLP